MCYKRTGWEGIYSIPLFRKMVLMDVGVAVRKIVHEKMTIPTIGYRYLMLQKGIEIEQKGMRLTGKAPACSAIVKNDYGITKGLSKKKTGLAFEMLLGLASMMYFEEVNA